MPGWHAAVLCGDLRLMRSAALSYKTELLDERRLEGQPGRGPPLERAQDIPVALMARQAAQGAVALRVVEAVLAAAGGSGLEFRKLSSRSSLSTPTRVSS